MSGGAVLALALALSAFAPHGEQVPTALPPGACAPDHDSAPAIEAFLARTPNGSAIRFPAGGRCLVQRTLDLSIPAPGGPVRENTTFDLNGSTIFRTGEPSCQEIRLCNGPLVSLHDVRSVVLENGVVAGAAGAEGLPSFDATREHDHGVAVHGASDVELVRLTVRDVAGDCVDVDRHDKTHAERIRILALTCTGAGRQGVSANAVTDLRVQRSTFDRIASTAVDLEPRRSGYIRGALVAGNRFGWVGHYAVAGIGSSTEWSDVRVADNVQSDPEHVGLAFLRAGNSFGRGPLWITGNRVRNVIQVNHTSGGGSGNVLLARPRSACLFELFNDPPFEVRDNVVPSGLQQACAFEGKIEAHTRAERIRRAVGEVLVWVVVAAVIATAIVLLIVLARRRRRA